MEDLNVASGPMVPKFLAETTVVLVEAGNLGKTFEL